MWRIIQSKNQNSTNMDTERHNENNRKQESKLAPMWSQEGTQTKRNHAKIHQKIITKASRKRSRERSVHKVAACPPPRLTRKITFYRHVADLGAHCAPSGLSRDPKIVRFRGWSCIEWQELDPGNVLRENITFLSILDAYMGGLARGKRSYRPILVAKYAVWLLHEKATENRAQRYPKMLPDSNPALRGTQFHHFGLTFGGCDLRRFWRPTKMRARSQKMSAMGGQSAKRTLVPGGPGPCFLPNPPFFSLRSQHSRQR